MNFDKRDAYRQQRVTDSDAGMRKCARVQQDEIDPAGTRLLYSFDYLVLRIALEALEFVPPLTGRGFEARLDCPERGVAVNAGFTAAEQIKIRPVDQ